MVLGFFMCFSVANALLYPVESPSRDIKILDGIWDFVLSPQFDQEAGFREKWYQGDLSKVGDVIPMPVPASFNDITQNRTIRDYIGWVWYGREFYAKPQSNKRFVLRVGSAHYTCVVWVNGHQVLNHSIGHLPFEADVTSVLNNSSVNKIVLALNNTLTPSTVPQGEIKYKTDPKNYPPGYFTMETHFDFFNYAGIHRPVLLYTTPINHISDMTVSTSIDGSYGIVNYDIVTTGDVNQCLIVVSLSDKSGAIVQTSHGANGSLTVKDANLWWPYLMNKSPGYLYDMEVHLQCPSPAEDDFYYLQIGIRKISWSNTTLLINDQPIYLRGFGKHEDSNIRGKGLDIPLILKDFNLIKWLGANSFRTSHYPYADEIMIQADKEGILVIDECPAVGLQSFGSELLKTHLQAVKEMINRDKNHPSVVMWSIANEPRTDKPEASTYFKTVADAARTLDITRPVTFVTNKGVKSDLAIKHVDIIMINRYYGWYSDYGHTEVIEKQLIQDVTEWNEVFSRPIMISEYGADTISGFHSDPSQMFTEDYQVELMRESFKAFDYLKSKNYLAGEMIWNFADFMTEQNTIRAYGNRKGILTRERQPKPSAHLLRNRYNTIANKNVPFYNCSIHSNLNTIYEVTYN